MNCFFVCHTYKVARKQYGLPILLACDFVCAYVIYMYMPVFYIGDFHVLLPLNILSDAKEHRNQIHVSFEIRRLSEGGTSFLPAFPSFFLFFLYSKKLIFPNLLISQVVCTFVYLSDMQYPHGINIII